MPNHVHNTHQNLISIGQQFGDEKKREKLWFQYHLKESDCVIGTLRDFVKELWARL